MRRGSCLATLSGVARLVRKADPVLAGAPIILTAGALARISNTYETAPGSRVPVQTLLDYLQAGETIDDFLEGFPSVSRDHVIAFLEMAKDRLIETAL